MPHIYRSVAALRLLKAGRASAQQNPTIGDRHTAITKTLADVPGRQHWCLRSPICRARPIPRIANKAHVLVYAVEESIADGRARR